MAKYVQLVMVNAVEGRDDEFNHWLDNHHIPEVLEAGGYATCHRFELASEAGGSPGAKRYMHLYEIETDDLAAARRRIDARRHLFTPFPEALDQGDMFFAHYKAR